MSQEQSHVPVLMDEVLHFLDIQPSGIYVDTTLGGGGHTRAILEKEPTCKVIGLDWDKSVIEGIGQQLQQDFPGRFFPVWGNFSRIHELVKKAGFEKVQGILADFGTSQIQIAHTPGLSIYNDDFLDMRMSAAHFKTTAYDIVNTFGQQELENIFYTYGEERFSRKIAQKIVDVRKKKKISTTGQLADLVKSVVPYKQGKIHPATRIFQALRIVVNKELDNILSFLANTMSILEHKGRLVCISFHSLEDRIVKQFLRDKNRKNNIHSYFEILTKKVCTASQEELEVNRSARSAKLRAAILQKDI